MRRIAMAMLCMASAGCALFGKPRTPHLSDVSSDLGCPAPKAVTASASTRLPQPGTPACEVVARYGEPRTVGTQSAAGMDLLSTTHRVNGRVVAITYVRYADTKENRALRRPIGQWLVQTASVR